jgi:hypothetical protein
VVRGRESEQDNVADVGERHIGLRGDDVRRPGPNDAERASVKASACVVPTSGRLAFQRRESRAARRPPGTAWLVPEWRTPPPMMTRSTSGRRMSASLDQGPPVRCRAGDAVESWREHGQSEPERLNLHLLRERNHHGSVSAGSVRTRATSGPGGGRAEEEIPRGRRR